MRGSDVLPEAGARDRVKVWTDREGMEGMEWNDRYGRTGKVWNGMTGRVRLLGHDWDPNAPQVRIYLVDQEGVGEAAPLGHWALGVVRRTVKPKMDGVMRQQYEQGRATNIHNPPPV